MSLELPTRIGRYEVLGVAGRGSTGLVLAAHDPFRRARVAIKLCPVLEGDERAARLARKLFFNEALAAGALDHPNILAVLDAGEEDGRPYLVLEHVAGARTLVPHVSPAGRLPLDEAVRVVFQVARALDYAHRRGVVHRDIKPGNVMLDAAGEVKVADFGIARYALAEATEVMGLLGSPRYMSPEQASDGEVGAGTDLFSLGVVFYELLTGCPPFAAASLSGLLDRIRHAEPEPPAAIRPDVPAGISDVVMRMLEKDPARRYHTGRAIAHDLGVVFGRLRPPRGGVDAERKLALVRRLRFFDGFTERELRALIDSARWEVHPAGTRIIDEGALEDCFYVLVDGDVEVRRGGLPIAHLTRGDCFGEMGYLSRARRSATIVAVDDATVVRIGAAEVERTTPSGQLRFCHAFLRALVGRLARTSEDLSRRS